MPVIRNIPTNQAASVVSIDIQINGASIPQRFAADTIAVYHEVNRIPTATIVLIDGDVSTENFTLSSNSLFAPGNTVELLLGYNSDNQSVFSGIITKQSIKLRNQGNAAIILECKHVAIKMTIGRKSKSYLDLSDSDVMQEILSDYGVDAAVVSTDEVRGQLVQYDCTDWDFVLSRAEANALICMVEKERVVIQAPDLNQEPALSLVHGATINALDLETDARLQQKEVTAQSWNSAEQEIMTGDAEEGNDTVGGSISLENLADVAAPEAYLLKHGGGLSNQELSSWANAFQVKRALAKIRGSVSCKGNTAIMAGQVVTLQGVGEVFSGNHLVSAVQHKVAGGDWQTTLQLGLQPEWFAEQFKISTTPAAGLLPAIQGLQIGVVSQLEDPDSEMRIKVKLPIVDAEAEGIWARVATLDAGSERGSFFLPEIGDEVIVGFLNDDPRHAVVLGMLYSAAHPAPVSAQDTNHHKGFFTRSDMQIVFDDEKKIMHLTTPGGKEIKLDESNDKITIKDNFDNALVMDSEGISLQSNAAIKIKAGTSVKVEGVNVETKATATYKASASGPVELSSSSTTTIKGSLVFIN